MPRLSSRSLILLGICLAGCQASAPRPFLDTQGKETLFPTGEKVLMGTPAATLLGALQAIEKDDFQAFADSFVPNVRQAILEARTREGQWEELKKLHATTKVKLLSEITDGSRAVVIFNRRFRKGDRDYQGDASLQLTLLNGKWLLDGWETQDAGPVEPVQDQI